MIGKRSDSFHQFLRSYTISSFSIYKKREAIAMAGKTRPTNGTKIDGKYAAAILKTPFFFLFFYYTTPKKRELFSMHSVCQVSRRPDEAFLFVLKFGFLNDFGQGGIRTLDSALRKRVL